MNATVINQRDLLLAVAGLETAIAGLSEMESDIDARIDAAPDSLPWEPFCTMCAPSQPTGANGICPQCGHRERRGAMIRVVRDDVHCSTLAAELLAEQLRTFLDLNDSLPPIRFAAGEVSHNPRGTEKALAGLDAAVSGLNNLATDAADGTPLYRLAASGAFVMEYSHGLLDTCLLRPTADELAERDDVARV